IVFQPEVADEKEVIENVRVKEGGEAIETSQPLEGYVDIQVKVMRDDVGGGYFQVLIQPNEKSAELNDVSKDVLFIIDHSGSIREGRLRQFKRITLEALAYLNPTDRFNIVSFAGKSETLFDSYVSPTQDNVQKAWKYVNRLASTGTTDVFGGVGPYVKRGNGDTTRPLIVFLMTDGQSTISMHRSADQEVDNRKANDVLKAIASSNPGNVSIYPFSAGKDSNRMLMDFMARLNGGMPFHAPRGDNFRAELSSYMRTHLSFVVRNFRYIAEGHLAEDIYPKTLPHLYRNESLALYGKFGPADDELVLTLFGYDAQGKLRNLVFKRKFSECEEIEQDSMESEIVSLREQWTAQKALHLLAEWVNSYDPSKDSHPEQRQRRRELNQLMGTINAFSKYSALLQ
ncbi:MAG: VWA domain-containing protein, partial [Victivallales bacterium]|nr:VWA domain-containing protein [Victivallales bacterium]